MVYDAGVAWHLNLDNLCAQRIDAQMPPGAAIDLMILSHSDKDHISSAAELLRLRTVKQIVRTGHARNTEAWCEMDYLVKTKLGGAKQLPMADYRNRLKACDESSNPIWVWRDEPWPVARAVDFNLQYFPISPGNDRFTIGQSPNAPTLTLLFGLHKTPDTWDDDFPHGSLESRQRNAISIVAKLVHFGHSVLFTGDAVGLRHGTGTSVEDLGERCIATERALLQFDDVGDVSLDSDILIAPHHGSPNGSCLEFIRRVSPGQVVFPAGHKYSHPALSTASRYQAAGVDPCDMLRTDRGDDEGRREWSGPARVDREPDHHSDDDILITLTRSGAAAEYRQKIGGVDRCPGW